MLACIKRNMKGLTPKLIGGEAVRVERNVRPLFVLISECVQ